MLQTFSKAFEHHPSPLPTMTYPQPKTLEEHRAYLHDIVRLKLWFLQHWLRLHPEETFSSVLRERVDIYRKTDVNPECLNPKVLHFDDPRWVAMENAAQDIYERTKDDPAAFEAQAFDVFRQSLDDRCERDFNDPSERIVYQCGCFRHNLSISPERYMGFHIANFLQPLSFFDYPDFMKGCFLMLLDRAENLFGATDISTGSWLNSMKRWQQWFPQEWLLNMRAPQMDVRWHYGYWGQFITARGTFNEKYGQYLRTYGTFPFYPRWSHCPIPVMRRHIQNLDLAQIR